MKKNCEVCNGEFDVRPAKYEERKTCSRECSKVQRANKVKCNCKTCGKELFKTESQIKKSKSGFVFCDRDCVGIYNGLARTQHIYKKCVMCNEEFKTIKAREEIHITCSNKCQGEWQSAFRTGENASNFRGGGGEKPCLYCDKKFTATTPSSYESRKFCSKDCKNSHWVENILHKSESFIYAHFDGNQKFREEHGETLPEKIVREHLESKGLIKDVDFFQERGFFRKYFADFFIPKTKTIIEVQGDFWHGNPEIYGEGKKLKPLYDVQIERINKDKEKREDFTKYGLNYHELWESDIYEDVEEAIQNVNVIIPRNDYTQDT